jgi:hypothetical protein
MAEQATPVMTRRPRLLTSLWMLLAANCTGPVLLKGTSGGPTYRGIGKCQRESAVR